jgi:aldehyde:ferredoxin oxidoreductase
MGNDGKLYGYVGKIARINLTEGSVEIIPTGKYVPKYIGGRSICNKIFWDEVKPGVKAFDPENKLIYMTGPTTATGIPTGGRTVFTGIAANNLPEQYSWSGIGGWFGAELKFAGFDGFILEGRAAEPTYLCIEDQKITFRSARNLWGKKVHDTQAKLEEWHGHETKSMVIGPAGENLMRNASITTSNDNVAAKSGFGAVFGSKNLKAITCKGTGVVVPYDIPKVLELRRKMGQPFMRPSPLVRESAHGMDGNAIPVEGGWIRGQVACSHGCNQHCNRLMIDMKSAFKEERVNHVEKCVSIFAFGFQEDCSWLPIQNWETKQNHFLPCKMLSLEMPEPDPSDPHFQELFKKVPGDKVDFWKPDLDKGSVMMDMCNEYGIDKWDVIVWLFPWLAMGKKEGVFDDIDFGMEIDVESEEFVKHMLDMITYRKGYYGDILAEGMARAIRILGKEKFGDTIYHGRYSQAVPGLRLDIPISLETAWGHSFHWQGRGFEGTINKPGWLATSLELMTSTRDIQTIAHHHDTFQNYLQIKDDPCHSQVLIDGVIMNENKAELKDSVSCCDWQSPNLFWTDMEAQMYTAATGYPISEQELNEAAERSRLLFRAILMRNFGRDRDLEVNAIFPTMQYPDPFGETVDWDDWNDLVDMYYDSRGWDRKTGWPYRETWEKYGLQDIADEMEKLSKLPRAATK